MRLNRAVAVAEVAGPLPALALLEGLDDALPRSHRLPAVPGELLLRAGQPDRARAAFTRAVELSARDPERAHLRRRIAAC